MSNDTIKNIVPELFEKKFSILQEISNIIVVTDNISAIANLMLDLSINYSDAEKGSLMLVNDRGELYILASRGIDIQLIRNYKVKIGEGIAGYVAKNRSPVLVENIDEDIRFRKLKRDRYKTKSFISCPIISKNKLLGVLNINDKKDDSLFTNDEFVLVKIIANQAAIALENAILVNQLKVKAAELEEMNRKLIETDAIKTEFFARVSHELRTPLNSIKGSIYYLEQSDKLTRTEQKEFYDIITNEAAKLISIVENQLDFLRLEDEARIISKTLINLSDILNEVLNSKILVNTLSRKNIKVNVDYGESISDIVGDRIKICQLFYNLIEGLSNFLESGDCIHITFTENDFLDVRLSLPRKLPETLKPYLFHSSQLFQTDQPEDKLKLYLARKIIEIHGWDLTAENVDNTFLVSLSIPKSKRQQMDASITTGIDLFLQYISEMLDINVCSIMLNDELTGELFIKSAKGLTEDIIKHTRIKPGDKISGWVALEGKPLLIDDIERDTRFGKINTPQYNTKSLLSVPLKIDNKIIGVLNLNNKKTAEPFTTCDLHIATVLGERVAHFLEKSYAHEYREEDFKQLMLSFDNLLNAEKKYPKKIDLFPKLMLLMMNELNVAEEVKQQALYISMIYDLGLMLIDESILNKKSLSSSELSSLKIHPYTTVGLLNGMEYSEEVQKAILHHHERYDGTGYPDGLKGEQIPFISRVLNVLDSFCAMVSKRPYRKEFTREDALQEIIKGSGSQYDPQIVSALNRILKTNAI